MSAIKEIFDFTKEEATRYKNKTHQQACEAIGNHCQMLETQYEVLLTWASKINKPLSRGDKFILNADGFDSPEEAIIVNIETLKQIVKKINGIRKFLKEPYYCNHSFGLGCVPYVFYPYSFEIKNTSEASKQSSFDVNSFLTLACYIHNINRDYRKMDTFN